MSIAELQLDIIDRIVNTQNTRVLELVSALLHDTNGEEGNHWDTLPIEEQNRMIAAAADTDNADRWVTWESIKEKYSKWD